MINLKVLQAHHGDCLILSYGQDKIKNIVIDSGHGKICFRKLKNYFVNSENNTVILTHYDYDHIGGFCSIAKTMSDFSSKIDKVFMNYGIELSRALNQAKKLQFGIDEASCNISLRQGENFYNYIKNKDIDFVPYISEGQKYECNDAVFTILSPSDEQLTKLVEKIGVEDDGQSECVDTNGANTNIGYTAPDYTESAEELANRKYNEDNSVTNFSSIAFMFEYENHKMLFLGDAVSSQIVDALKKLGYSEENKLTVDYCKIAHHGSNYNTSNELVKMLDCSNYIISSDWNSDRPGKECLSRIIVNSSEPVKFLCNYDKYKNKKMFTDEEAERYRFKFELIDEDGITIQE